MNTVIRIARIFAALLLLFVIAVALSWWLLPDEELDPAARDFAVQQLPPSVEANGNFLLWGFSASPELDAHVVGQRIVADHDRLLAAQKTVAGFDSDSAAYLGNTPLTFPNDYTNLCDPQREPCLPLLLAAGDEIRQRSARYQVYLERYRRLRDYPHFQLALSWSTIDSPMPAYGPIMRMADLVDGTIAQRMLEPADQQAALEELAAEIRLWTRIQQADDWVITQMIATASLHKKYRLAAELLNRFPEVVAHYPALVQTITTPLLPTESGIATSLHAEYMFTFNGLSEPGQAYDYSESMRFVGDMADGLRAGLFSNGFFRMNATLNQYYRVYKRLIDFHTANNSPRALLSENDNFMAELREAAALSPSALFYNPGGRLLNSTAWQDWSIYALRIHHLIGQSRLLEIQRRLIMEQVPVAEVAATLARWSPQLDDPFSEKPMQWDSATRRLYYDLPEYQGFSGGSWNGLASITLDYLQ